MIHIFNSFVFDECNTPISHRRMFDFRWFRSIFIHLYEVNYCVYSIVCLFVCLFVCVFWFVVFKFDSSILLHVDVNCASRGWGGLRCQCIIGFTAPWDDTLQLLILLSFIMWYFENKNNVMVRYMIYELKDDKSEYANEQ